MACVPRSVLSEAAASSSFRLVCRERRGAGADPNVMLHQPVSVSAAGCRFILRPPLTEPLLRSDAAASDRTELDQIGPLLHSGFTLK